MKINLTPFLNAPNETTPQGLANATEVDPVENIVRIEPVKQKISDYVSLHPISESEMSPNLTRQADERCFRNLPGRLIRVALTAGYDVSKH